MRRNGTAMDWMLVPLLALAGVACPGGGTSSDSAPAAAPKLGSGEGDDRVLAVVGDEAITVGDFKARMNRQSPYIRARYNSPERRRQFLDNMIRFELQAEAAAERGLDENPDVQRTRKQVMIQKLTKQIFKSKLKPEDITEAEIEQYYQDHERDYNKPEMVRASHIFFKVADVNDAAAVAAARRRARDALRELKGRKELASAFSELAKKYSEDPRTRNRGGDLGYFAKVEEGGTQEKAVSDAAFALKKVNDLSGVVRGKGGFHILRLTAKRKAIAKTLEQVKPSIRSRIYRRQRRQLFKDYIEDLRSKATIEIDEAALEKIEIEGATAPPRRPRRPPAAAPAQKQ